MSPMTQRRRWELNPRVTDLQSVANAQNPREKSGLVSSVAQKVATDTAENGCERLISLAETDPELTRLVSAWPKLSAVVKRMILAALEADEKECS